MGGGHRGQEGGQGGVRLGQTSGTRWVVGVCGESVLEEGFGDGVDHQHQDVAAHWADVLHKMGI